MNVLFLIGNGFDLNMGLKTSYSDFYEYYKQVPSATDSITKLKKSIANSIIDWADLELALGQYTKEIKSTEEFDDTYENIGEELSKYLQREEDNFDFGRIDRKKLFDCLSYPENFLPAADREKITSFRNTWKGLHLQVRIITYNYTKSIEKILGANLTKLQIGSHHNSSIVLSGVEHVHGYANDRMVMGVNDVSQIGNPEFHDNQDILEAIVKTICNQAYRHNIDISCKKQISSANMICVFGSSIGDTDKIWWELIGKQLTNNCQLIIFYRDKDIPARIAYKKNRLERRMKEKFLMQANVPEETRAEIAKKIFIGLNTNMFNIIK